MDQILDAHLNGQPHGLIPRGVADYFWDAAAERRALEDRLLEVFRQWGYGYLIPPTLEYASTFEQHTGFPFNKRDLYRFLDHDGRSLALRYDVTVAVARLMGTRLHDAPMPQRFCYVGNVFRHSDAKAGQQREFWQAGIELVGANTPEADAEVLALTARALQVAGLDNFRLTLGQFRFFNGLLAELRLEQKEQAQLRQALERRSEPELVQFFSQSNLTAKQQHVLELLMRLSGADLLRTVDEAREACLNSEMEQALDNIEEIYQVLKAYDVAHLVHLDLTEITDLGYYTGIRFIAYAPGVGFGIASGGRYDNLIGTFGPPQPAVGAALGMERMLLALHSSKTGAVPALKTHVLVATDNNYLCYQTIERWRAKGIKAIVDVNGRRGTALWFAAQEKGIPCALVWTGQGFDVYDDTTTSDGPTRKISAAESDAFLAAILL